MPSKSGDLRLIRLRELRDYTVLPGNLYNHHGTVLLPRGSPYDESLLGNNRMRFFYVDEQWDPVPSENSPPDPREVIEAIAEQHGETVTQVDRRQYPRRDWNVKLTLQLEELQPASEYREIKVVSCDLSSGGFAFTHSHYVYEGVLARVRFETLPHRPILAGITRSCVPIGGAKHRIGVEFVKRE